MLWPISKSAICAAFNMASPRRLCWPLNGTRSATFTGGKLAVDGAARWAVCGAADSAASGAGVLACGVVVIGFEP